MCMFFFQSLRMSDTPSTNRQINRIAGWRYLLLLLLVGGIRMWHLTLRMRVADEETVRALSYDERPTVQLTWHNRLFMIPAYVKRYRQGRPLAALISASRDGAWLAQFMEMLKVKTVRGSSSWRAAQAAKELLSTLDSGVDVGITPDGPRGPCYSIKPGAVELARKAGCPLILVTCAYSCAWRLNSWDKFFLPLPGSRVVLHARLITDLSTLPENEEAGALELRNRLLEMCPDPDVLMPEDSV